MKISIIIPVYKVEKYIDRCVKSVQEQSFNNIEIILVDDGSPDRCGEICDQYAKNDSRIKVIHKENGGLSDARNAGTEIANGDYIMYVDSDDTIEKTACEELADIIEKYNADIVCFNLRLINEETQEIINEKFYNYSNTKNIKPISYEQAIEDNINRKNIRYEAPSKIYKKDIVKGIKFPKGILGEDFAVFYKFLKESKCTIYYDRNLYNYYQRSSSIMGEKNIKLYIDVYNTEKEYYKTAKGLNLEKETIAKLEDNLFKTLIKTFTKLNNNIKKEEYKNIILDVKEDINKIEFCKISPKMKIIYILFRLNNNIAAKALNKLIK